MRHDEVNYEVRMSNMAPDTEDENSKIVLRKFEVIESVSGELVMESSTSIKNALRGDSSCRILNIDEHANPDGLGVLEVYALLMNAIECYCKVNKIPEILFMEGNSRAMNIAIERGYRFYSNTLRKRIN